jgi:hypothetical protein
MMLLLETASYGRPGSLTIFITPGCQMLYDEDVTPAIAVTYSSLGVKALIKQDIIHQVIAKTGLPRNKAEAAVDTVFESLKKALASGDRSMFARARRELAAIQEPVRKSPSLRARLFASSRARNFICWIHSILP